MRFLPRDVTQERAVLSIQAVQEQASAWVSEGYSHRQWQTASLVLLSCTNLFVDGGPTFVISIPLAVTARLQNTSVKGL